MIDPTAKLFRWGPVPGRYFYMSEFIPVCYKHFKERFPKCFWPEGIILFKDKRMVWVHDDNSFRDEARKVFTQYTLHEKQRETLYGEWLFHLKKLIRYQEHINTVELAKISNEDLLQIWEKFFELVIAFWIPTIPPELGNYGSESILQEELQQYILDQDELRVAMEILTAPEEISFYQEEEIELAKTENIEAHQKKYFWLHNSYAGVDELWVANFEERKKNIPKTIEEELEIRIETTKEEREEIIKRYDLPEDIKKIAKAIRANIVWQDQRKKYIFINLHYKDLLCKEVARRFNYDYNDLLNANYQEVAEIINDQQMQRVLQKRRKSFGIHFTEEEKLLSPEEAAKAWDEFAQEKVAKAITEFTGTVASKGVSRFTRGKVRIVFDPFEADAFKEGEILVAPMTSPEYVFLMKKADAIITDTGGLTCHAAIVSREFSTPCIVGTRVATQALKDGQTVEVNTEKGIVRIIED